MKRKTAVFKQRDFLAANRTLLIVCAAIFVLAFFTDGFTRWFLLALLMLTLWFRVGGFVRRGTVIEIDGTAMRVTRGGRTKAYPWADISEPRFKTVLAMGIGVDRIVRFRHGWLMHDIILSEMEDEEGLVSAIRIMWSGTRLEQAGTFDRALET